MTGFVKEPGLPKKEEPLGNKAGGFGGTTEASIRGLPTFYDRNWEFDQGISHRKIPLGKLLKK